MEEAIDKALCVLGYKEIRPNQKLVVTQYLSGKDVLFCSPTGSGKSLTFEIAPFVFKFLSQNDMELSTVIVVSPLVALMQYQAAQLTKKGVRAVYLQDAISETSNSPQITMEGISSGKCDVVFASPESLLGDFRSLLVNLSNKKALKAIFVDEAHCIKKFGKSEGKRKTSSLTSGSPFRPQYGELGQLRSLIARSIPVVALTATATEETRNIILKDLCMKNAEQIIINPNKPNVKYSVEVTTEKDVCNNFRWLLDILSSEGVACPRIIIFFRQIKYIAEVFGHLQANLKEKQYAENQTTCSGNGYWNRLFGMFHSATSEKIKQSICQSFQDEKGTVRIVLCSTSFSMGLDVKSVHTVVHYGPANDLDDYLQESGRAGRDPTQQCNAVLIKYKYSLNSQNVTPVMKQYVTGSMCRRMKLLLPFTKDAKSVLPKHNCCDICTKTCTCACSCNTECTCTYTCLASESKLLIDIRNSFEQDYNDLSSDSSNEDFESDSDIELFIRRRPQIVYSSDSG